MGERDEIWYAEQKTKAEVAIGKRAVRKTGVEQIVESTLVISMWLLIVIVLPAYVIFHFIVKSW